MSSARFSTKTYVFDPRPTYPLRLVVKRYWRPESPYLRDPAALTLVFAHGTSFHKEAWEPVMDDLQAQVDGDGDAGGGAVKIRECWSIDAPNHGEGAGVNVEALKIGFQDIFGWEEYARSIHLFLSGFGKGVDVDFRGHNLVGIGHSMGAVALALSRGYYPKVTFRAFVMCEVMALPRNAGRGARDMLVSGARKRRDIWASKEEAYQFLKAKGMGKFWDDRTVRLYAEHALCPLPTPEYPDKTDGVTLRCTRDQEAATYSDPIGFHRVYDSFGNIVKDVPTHLIYGAIDDYLTAEIKTDIVENRVGGLQNLASFARVPKAGHLIVQMNPTGLAEKIKDALVIVSRELKAKETKL